MGSLPGARGFGSAKAPADCLAYRAVGRVSFDVSCGASPPASRVHVTCSCVKTLFGDSAGEEDQSSSSTMSDLPKPSEVDADNIIKPSLDEISADHRQVYEEYKKAREEKDL